MAHCCCVLFCSIRSNKERNLSFFSLPLRNKQPLKIWIHRIRRKKLSTNCYTRVCSEHFVRATGCRLLPRESSSLGRPFFKESVREKQRRQPREHPGIVQFSDDASDDSEE